MIKYIKNIKISWLLFVAAAIVVVMGGIVYNRVILNTSSVPSPSEIASEVENTNQLNGSDALPQTYMEAKWPAFESLESMTDYSDVILLGRAIKSEPGRLVPDAASSVGLPFMNTWIEAEIVLKGNVSEGEQIVVEQTGGEYIPTHYLEDLELPILPLPPEAGETEEAFQERQRELEEQRKNAPSKVWLEIKDNPLFVADERVVLFLSWKPALGVYQTISPQGRFGLDENDQLVPMWQENSVSQVFAGKSPNVLQDAVSAILSQ